MIIGTNGAALKKNECRDGAREEDLSMVFHNGAINN